MPWTKSPPAQPLLKVTQSTNSCEEKLVMFGLTVLFLFKNWPSRAPAVANAQHEPHWPWYLTDVTNPDCLQSVKKKNKKFKNYLKVAI